MNIKMCEKAKDILITALRMYIGDYECYGGADYFRAEATNLIPRIMALEFNGLKVGWNPMLPCKKTADIHLSENEEEALRCSLELYTGKYEDYAGASIWKEEAEGFIDALQTYESDVSLFV